MLVRGRYTNAYCHTDLCHIRQRRHIRSIDLMILSAQQDRLHVIRQEAIGYRPANGHTSTAAFHDTDAGTTGHLDIRIIGMILHRSLASIRTGSLVRIHRIVLHQCIDTVLIAID